MTQTREPRMLQEEAGFVLIEVLVSAIIIVTVAGAVFTLLNATTRSAAAERVHSDAYGLAQEDQARLRTMRISSLNHLVQTRSVTLNGTQFTVESTGVFVNNTSGTASCTAAESSADYVRITSTVRWPNIESRQPVVIQSVVSPSNGSLDPSHGTLTFAATNAAGKPLAGVAISGTGAGTFSGSTDSSGCATFPDLPAGNYTVTTSAGGMINMLGETSTSKTVGAIPGSTQTVSLRYDTAGWIEATFKYRVGSSGVFKPATADSLLVYNAESGTTGQAFWNTAHARELQVKAAPLFPFTHADTVYAGACEKNNPVPKEEANPPGAPAEATVIVPPNEKATALIQLPALNLTVKNSGVPVSGAKVTVTDENCKEEKGSYVKRIYTTNASGNQSATTNGEAEPGLPWGSYEVCASASFTEAGKSVIHRVKASGVSVQNLTSGTTLALELSASGWEKGTACP